MLRHSEKLLTSPDRLIAMAHGYPKAHFRRWVREPFIEQRRRAVLIVVEIHEHDPRIELSRLIVAIEALTQESFTVFPVNRANASANVRDEPL